MIQVTFKHEGEDALGIPFGPCTTIDVAARDADPNVGSLGMPFGYDPPWIIQQDWMSLTSAKRVAREAGVELEQS